MKKLLAIAAAMLMAAGCVTESGDVKEAVFALQTGNDQLAIKWSEDLATDSTYSQTLGLVEAGRVNMLAGRYDAAESWFRQAVDTAVDRKEAQPKLKIGDMANTALSATVTDDRTRNYYLPAYELNMALEYGIIAELMNGKRDDALADARLAVYVQNALADEYGADVAKTAAGASQDAQGMCSEQSARLDELVAESSNSWENPVLWWLTDVMLDQNGETEMALASYRKASVLSPGNPYTSQRAPAADKARLVVIYDQDFVSRRKSLKVPVPIYTMMSIDIPMYEDTPYVPERVRIAGSKGEAEAMPTLNVQALAARDLKEQLPGIITRNLTRAATAAAAQAAVNASGNSYAKLGMMAVNGVAMAIRRADTRSWVTLPMGQQIWSDSEMEPGDYQIGVNVNGAVYTTQVPLKAGKTRLLYISHITNGFRGGNCEL